MYDLPINNAILVRPYQPSPEAADVTVHAGTIAKVAPSIAATAARQETFVARTADSLSGQEYTPFARHELTDRVKTTFVHNHRVYDYGRIVGALIGQYVKRPAMAPTGWYREEQP